MRELIKIIKINGEVVINNKYNFSNVHGEFQYDEYSNNNMKGQLIVKDIFSQILDFNEIDIIEFIGNGFDIKGEVYTWEFGNNHILSFKIKELKLRLIHSSEKPCKINLYFYIPYIAPLSRKIRYNDPEDKYIIKYKNEEFNLKINDTLISFKEKLKIPDLNKPDILVNRFLYPHIGLKFENWEKLEEDIKESYDLIKIFMCILSLLLFKRIYSYGYNAELIDNEGGLLQETLLKNTIKKSGKDYIEDMGLKFNNYFNSKNISDLVESFLSLDKIGRENFTRVLNAYLTIDELGVFEPRFKDSYFALEAISKLIVKPNGKKKSEELIIEACENAEILINFNSSLNSKKLKWLITEYRNELTHFNFVNDFEKEILVEEFYKILIILRKLIIFYLVPGLRDFPYPKDKYKF